MSAPAGEEQGSSLAAKVSALRDGQPLTHLDRAELELALVDIALGNKASWSQIGALVWGCTGPEAKRRVHRLRAQVQRARRLEDNRGEEGAGDA